MKFKGAGLVWDAENNKTLIEFVNGVCETTDQRVIDILNKNGFQELNEVQNLETHTTIDNSGTYEGTEIDPDVEIEETIEEQKDPKTIWNDLKRKAISLGISVKGKKAVELKKLISEKENAVDNIN